jgi:hypothetical protein
MVKFVDQTEIGSAWQVVSLPGMFWQGKSINSIRGIVTTESLNQEVSITRQEIIDRAYEATIEQIYSVLYNAHLIAHDSAEREDAERRFQTGCTESSGDSRSRQATHPLTKSAARK